VAFSNSQQSTYNKLTVQVKEPHRCYHSEKALLVVAAEIDEDLVAI